MIKAIFILLTVMTLYGCGSYRPAPSHEVVSIPNSVLTPQVILPGLAPVPKVTTFLNNNGVLEDNEIKAYYKALSGYNTYLASYMDYLSKQYKLGYKRKLDCFTVAKAPKIPIPENPNVIGIPEDRISDVLVDHIEKLRELMRKHNEIIDKQNQMIDMFCS